MPNARPDPGYRPGGTTNFYEGMVPYYQQQFGQQQQPMKPAQAVADAPPANPERVPEKPNMIQQLKEKAKAFNDNVGLAGNTARSVGTAAGLASGAAAAMNLSDRLNQPTGRATAYYPARTSPGMLNAGMGSGMALGSSSVDTPASP